MAELFVNSGGPDQIPRSAVSDLGLHCLPILLLGSPDYNGLMHFTISTDPVRESQRPCIECMNVKAELNLFMYCVPNFIYP